MKSIIGTLILMASLVSCSNNDETLVPNIQEEAVPVVKATATYNVLVQEDVIYAEGLSHESINSANATTIPLKLDIYTPDNTITNRPVYLFIHGGGFIGGNKKGSTILNLANYYTSRGWVFISINYRLRDDNGTVPQEWLDFSETYPSPTNAQIRAMYPAQRDAKAALRWLVANAPTYNINTDYITVGGGSAGAITAITVSVSNPEDFKDEIDTVQDPTLSSTNPEQSYKVQTIINHWGSKSPLDILELVYGHQRFDSNDPALFIVHGTEDATVPFSRAEELKEIYEANGLPLAFYPLEGLGHSVWDATVNGKRLEELAFDFIVAQQKLKVE